MKIVTLLIQTLKSFFDNQKNSPPPHLPESESIRIDAEFDLKTQQTSVLPKLPPNNKVPEQSETPTVQNIPEQDKAFTRKLKLATLANTPGIGYHSLRGIYPILDVDFNSIGQDEILFRLPKGLRNRESIARILKESDPVLHEKTRQRFMSYTGNGLKFLIDSEDAFPKELSNIKTPPYWLFVQGDEKLLKSEKIIAVVGTRHPTQHSLTVTRELVKILVSNGYIVLSGLANGIDYQAHKTTLDFGGKTIVILGHGMNVSLSQESWRMREDILNMGGTVVTEYFPNVRYSRETFVLRNRIQTALSRAVVPVECKIKSGTAHTIRYAEEQKKRLFGVQFEGIRDDQNEVFEIMTKHEKPVFNLSNQTEEMLKYIEERFSTNSHGAIQESLKFLEE